MYGGCRYEADPTGCSTKFSVVYGSHLFICFYVTVRANTRSVDLLTKLFVALYISSYVV